MLSIQRSSSVSAALVYGKQSPQAFTPFALHVQRCRGSACSLKRPICVNSTRLLRSAAANGRQIWETNGFRPGSALEGSRLLGRFKEFTFQVSCAGGKSGAAPLKDLRLFQSEARLPLSTRGSSPRVWRIVFVGRANVGKSSLYNRFLTAAGKSASRRRRIDLAIVGEQAGTTRDRREALCSIGSLNLCISDTGGAQEQTDQGGDLLSQIGEQVDRAVAESDIVVFVLDARDGVTPLDELLAKWIREKVQMNSISLESADRSAENSTQSAERNAKGNFSATGLPPSIVVVLNKAEDPESAACIADVYEMQLGDPVLVSAKHNRGLDDLYERLRQEVNDRAKSIVVHDAGRDEVESTGSSSDVTESYYASETVRQAPPTPTPASIAWLEGLARRYGGGVKTTLAAVQNPQSSMHLPWDFDKTALALPAAEARATLTLKQDCALGIPETPSENSEFESDSQDEETMSEDEGEDVLSFLKNASPTERQIILKQLQDMNINVGELEEFERSSEQSGESRVKDGSSLKRNPLEGDRDEMLCITFIGRPNAGKSTLINSLLGYSRLVVSEKPGTTTDSVEVEFEFKRRKILLTDTAGVTRGWRMRKDDLFQEACLQTLRNVRRSQVCVLCLDAAHVEETGAIASNDLALACRASKEEGRCLVVCVTKWDLIHPSKQEATRSMILERLHTGLGHLKGCPVVFTSARNSQNLNTLLNKALLLYKRWETRVSTPRLNGWLQEYTARWPPPWRRGSQCNVKYITQVKAKPPTFVAWSNVYAHFPLHYQRQLVNAMREEFGMMGIPIRFVMRTTAMPKPGMKLTKAEALKWKRLGPLQHQAAAKLGRKYKVKKFQQPRAKANGQQIVPEFSY